MFHRLLSTRAQARVIVAEWASELNPIWWPALLLPIKITRQCTKVNLHQRRMMQTSSEDEFERKCHYRTLITIQTPSMHGILCITLSCLHGIRMDCCSLSLGLPKTENIVAMHSSTDSTLLLRHCGQVGEKGEWISPRFKVSVKVVLQNMCQRITTELQTQEDVRPASVPAHHKKAFHLKKQSKAASYQKNNSEGP